MPGGDFGFHDFARGEEVGAFPDLCDGHGNKVLEGDLGGGVAGDAEEGEGVGVLEEEEALI